MLQGKKGLVLEKELKEKSSLVTETIVWKKNVFAEQLIE